MEQMFLYPNGVRIYRFPNPNLHTFRLSLFVPAGTMYSPEAPGITHLFEHLTFRNINKLYQGRLYALLNRACLDFNACTYKEFLHFEMSGPSSQLALGVEVMSRIFCPLALTPAEIETEKSVIRAEISENGRRNSTEACANRLFWSGTANSLPILGNRTTLRRLSGKKLQEYQQSVLTCDTLFFYLTGNDRGEGVQRLQAAIGALPLPASPKVYDNCAAVPADFGQRDCKARVYPSQLYNTASIHFDLDCRRYSYALRTVLYHLLFGGDGCAFNQRLKEDLGLIYSFDARLEEYCNIGNLHVSFEAPDPATLKRAIAEALQIFQQLKKPQALDAIKESLLLELSILPDSPEDLEWQFAYSGHILGESYHTLEDVARAIRAVTPAQLAALAQDTFRPARLCLFAKSTKFLSPDHLRQLACTLEDDAPCD